MEIETVLNVYILNVKKRKYKLLVQKIQLEIRFYK